MNIHLRFSKYCWQYPILVTLHEKSRSSRREVFCKNDVFENFANQKCFSMNLAKYSRTPLVVPSEKLKAEAILRRCYEKNLFLKISQTKCVLLEPLEHNFVFSCEFCKIFKSTFFHGTSPAAASEKLKAETVVRICSVKKVFLEVVLNPQENTCARVSFLQPYECIFIKIESLTQAFSCDFCEHLSKNTFLTEHIGGCSSKSLQLY